MRLFKSKHFATHARKARIGDDELRRALREVALGQCDDLGGRVYKKRLNANEHRAIILTVTERGFWILEYLFAKKDRANIDQSELLSFRKLARMYERVSERDVEALVASGEWVEISDGSQV